jgi:hypothetical protein
MLAGHSYEQALKVVREDNLLHPMFHREPLRDTLVNMIWNSELDSTPWTRYVPEVYFLSAETKLESMYCREETIENWHALEQEFEQEPEPSSSPSVSDNDSSYSPDDPGNDGEADLDPDAEVDLIEISSDSIVPSKSARGHLDVSSDSEDRRSPPTKRVASPAPSGTAVKKRRTTIGIESRFEESPQSIFSPCVRPVQGSDIGSASSH